MYYLLQSNQGNHTGFNRVWQVIEHNESKEKLISKLYDIALRCSDNYSYNDENNVVDENGNIKYEGTESFEDNLIYYTIESDEDIELLHTYSTGHRFGIDTAIKIYNKDKA
jgi:hypothetical protein